MGCSGQLGWCRESGLGPSGGKGQPREAQEGLRCAVLLLVLPRSLEAPALQTFLCTRVLFGL
jgi:hypothetical protein